MRAFDLACDTCWAIRRDALETVLEVAARLNGVETEADFDVLSAKLGRPLENTHQVTVRNGVATIPVDGVLMPKGNMFTRVSGATSYDVLARDFRQAVEDPSVRAVLLSVDSPGGAAKGAQELAALIRGARGSKPIHAHVWGFGSSGAFWLASSASHVSVGKTAQVGSIGAVMVYRNRKNEGEIEFVSSVSPKKRLDPATDEGRADVQATVDRLGELFVEEVAANRGVVPEKVLADFGRGSEMFGREAVAAGMADAVSTYEEAHAALEASARPRLSFLMPGVSVPAPSVTFGVPT